MTQALRQTTVIGSGGRVELPHTSLPEGAQAEVIVLVESPPAKKRPMMDFLGLGRGAYGSEEAVVFIRQLRDEWEDSQTGFPTCR